MKKLLCFMLAALMLMSSTALADVKTLNPQENRGITLKEVGLNEVEEGISPTTGLTLSTLKDEQKANDGFTGMAYTGRYLPMMVQIANDNGGVDARAQWGIAYADVIYECLLYRDYANTRFCAVFNDVIPNSVGFVRSMRMAMVWLREEWGAAFMFHGEQKYDYANTVEESKNLGHNYVTDPLFFDGTTGGKSWNPYFTDRAGLNSPYQKDVNAAAIYKLVPEDYVAPNHTFKFTDEVPEGDTALSIRVDWKDLPAGYNKAYYFGSNLVYDADSNSYLRYVRHGADSNHDYSLHAWVDKDAGTQLAFANVIVQFVKTEFPAKDAPIQYVIGKNGNNYTAVEGNADFFMAGKHVSGYWKHESATDRTVFYGPDGDEISLQRGKTLVILFPDNNVLDSGDTLTGSVTYSDDPLYE